MNGVLERVAGAPITWGVCEVPGWGYQLDAARVLGEMTEVGLQATELGPDGFLPTDPSELRMTLASYGLQLVGGFVPAVLHDPARRGVELARVRRSADLLSAAGSSILVLAASTGAYGYEAAGDLDAETWAHLTAGIDRVVEIANGLGMTVGFHPHHGTLVEGPEQVQRLLETSDVALCVDTGHLMVGGADPVSIVEEAGHRVVHVHLKDVDAEMAEEVRSRRIGYHDAVRRGLYRPLGLGDVDIGQIVGRLEGAGYGGWYVLEQDTVLIDHPEEGAGPVEDARANLDGLRRIEDVLGREAPEGSPNGEHSPHAASAGGRREEGR